MNWKGFAVRVGMVVVALPLIGVFVFLLPWRTHLALNSMIVVVTVIGSIEMVGLFAARRVPVSRVLAPVLAGTLPAAAYLQAAGLLPGIELHLLWAVAVPGIILVRAIMFRRQASLRALLAYSGSSLLAALYPALFLSFLPRMSGLADPALAMAFFLCVIFGDDMLAYFVGSLWGRSTRLDLPVSPRKSVLGFAGGIAGALIVALLFHWLAGGFPGRGLAVDLAIAAAVGAVGIVGDLVESGLKRSAGVKDSGVVIPGRGGILDSLDSAALAAPLFWLLMVLIPAR
ncbi:MAG TPA: phosphatidate cytidylyltransferase [Desulfobacterales bacterium]|nr:phosphatidate cytidylyltransferase [Desulfobacterales bacterium]